MNTTLKLLITLSFMLVSTVQGSAQETEDRASIQFYVGGAYTIAPTFNVAGKWTINANTSANFYSLFVDLIINDQLIGRAQTSFLAVGTLGDDLSNELVSGFEMNGSMGYNYRLGSEPKISIPIMATLGYASVKDDDARDPGMQVGATLGLNYAVTSRLNASTTFRYLKGLGFNDGTKIDQIDLSIGVQFRL